MVRLVDQLELTRAATKVGHADQTEVPEELQRAVDGRAIDRRQLRFDPGKDVVRREVLAGLERTQNDQPLRGGALPDTAQPLHQTADISESCLSLRSVASLDAHDVPMG